MTCNGNCNQGREPCNCQQIDGDWWVTRISIIGSIVIVILIALEVM